jgi:hypothetical protein
MKGEFEMSKFDDIWDNPYDGYFDFNGDGKEDIDEQCIGDYVINECAKQAGLYNNELFDDADSFDADDSFDEDEYSLDENDDFLTKI